MKIAGAIASENIGKIKRKWKIKLDPKISLSIETGREEWNKWLKATHNTNNRKVWEVYDHLASDLCHEVLTELLGTIDKDLDSYCEKVIIDEFQLDQ